MVGTPLPAKDSAKLCNGAPALLHEAAGSVLKPETIGNDPFAVFSVRPHCPALYKPQSLTFLAKENHLASLAHPSH